MISIRLYGNCQLSVNNIRRLRQPRNTEWRHYSGSVAFSWCGEGVVRSSQKVMKARAGGEFSSVKDRWYTVFRQQDVSTPKGPSSVVQNKTCKISVTAA